MLFDARLWGGGGCGVIVRYIVVVPFAEFGVYRRYVLCSVSGLTETFMLKGDCDYIEIWLITAYDEVLDGF